MKEFELQEDHEFFDVPVGQDTLPSDSDEDLYMRKDQILASLAQKLEEHLKNGRLTEVYLNLEFHGDDGISNYINITWHPQS